MRLVAVGTAARAPWSRALAEDAAALVSQTPTWLDLVCEVGPYVDVSRAYRAADGRELVLPLVRRHGVPIESSMPFGWGTGGLVGARLRAADVAAVAADLSTLRQARIAVRPAPARDSDWAAAAPPRARHMSQVLDLSEGFSAVWSDRFSSNVRRACRRAERLGLTVECDSDGRLVGVFDELYRGSITRWARDQHEPERLAQWRGRRRDPLRKFAVVAAGLGGDCRVWLARRSGEPAAAIIVLARGEHSTYWRGAMDVEVARGTGANEWLHRLVIEDACVHGRRWYHMGQSAPGSSLARFKRGFGTVEVTHGDYAFERLPLTAADAVLRGAVKRLVRMRS